MEASSDTRYSWSSSSLENHVLLLLFIVISPYAQVGEAGLAPAPLYLESSLCNTANYTKLSKFESNLNTLLNNLVRHSSSSGGFNTSVSGQNPDKIYGLLQCRGDASVEECYNCSRQAITSVRQLCGNAKGAYLWLEKCFLRYENSNFIGQLDTNNQKLYNVGNATDPVVFSGAVRGLFKNLSGEAYVSANRYSSGTTTDSSYEKIFGLVQCCMDISHDDCTTCLSMALADLSELTHSYTRQGGVLLMGSCIARYESYPFFTPSPPLRPPNSTSSTPLPSHPTLTKKTHKMPIILGIVGGLLMVLLLCLFANRRKLKRAVFGKPIVLRAREKANGNINEDSIIFEDHQTIFNLETLVAATKNFHEDNKLGEGGFGPVYKGTMPDGTEIAVKKLSIKSTQGKKEFLNEIKLVAKVQHRNLVNLIGCCAEGRERLLVYEYLSNRSLDKILFHPQRSKQLEWEKRLNITIGVARGLCYLHEDSLLRIIHRDIKASNILLDDQMNPKIADFGLARLFPKDNTHVSTRIAGTYGYMAPEYAMMGQLSFKADVYSYGVVLLEILCGRKNTDIKLSPQFQSLLELVWRSYSDGKVMDVIDIAVIQNCPKEQALRYIHIGLLCTQAEASLRPPMSTVYSMLLSNPSFTDLPYPTKPAFVSAAEEHVEPQISGSTTSTSSQVVTPLVIPSNNDVSVTDLAGR